MKAENPETGEGHPAALVEEHEDLQKVLETVDPPLPARGLFEFYDRLREKVLHAVEEKGGSFGEKVAEALLLVPDIFILLVRLVLDSEVPGGARALIAGALAYFILPLDLLPEAILGPGGYLEDLILAAAVLSQAFSGELEKYAQKHWTGSHELTHVLERLTQSGEELLDATVHGRLRRLLSHRGVDLGGSVKKIRKPDDSEEP
jgi:uncharacterized membrane protein YkvA (DUF1232 family)